MTRQQSIKYAQECRYAKANGLPKPPRPDGLPIGTITHHPEIKPTEQQTFYKQGISDITKQVNQAAIKIEMINNLCDKIDDYFTAAKQTSPRANVYAELFNYVWSELQTIENTLKRIK